MIDKEKSLAYRFPELAKEWHHTKYGDLTPFNVAEDVIQTYGTSKHFGPLFVGIIL